MRSADDSAGRVYLLQYDYGNHHEALGCLYYKAAYVQCAAVCTRPVTSASAAGCAIGGIGGARRVVLAGIRLAAAIDHGAVALVAWQKSRLAI